VSDRRASGILIGAVLLAGCGGEAAEATVPDGWLVHESEELGYTMTHPDGWQVAFDPVGTADVYDGADGVVIRVAAYLDEDGWPADRIFLGAVADAQAAHGFAPQLLQQWTGPDDARIHVYVGESTAMSDEPQFFQRAVVLTPPHIWYVDWYSTAGDEGGDRSRFLEFVRSFMPAPGLGGQQQG
jgi:hypothetical protein